MNEQRNSLIVLTVAGTSISTIAYQGRLADSNGNPLTSTLAIV